MRTKIQYSSILKLGSFIFALLLIGSCRDYLDLEPETNLSTAVAFDNIVGIEAGINGAYSKIHNDWPERQIIFSETFANNVREVNTLGNSNYQATLRHQSWTDLYQTGNYVYRMGYQVIDVMNQIILAIPKIPTINESVQADKDRLLGEAYFLRGLQYFVLNRFYGQPQNGLSVPLSLTPFDPDFNYGRATIEEVKAQVISDLTEAKQLMADVERNNDRATIWAIKSILARVYFEYKQYDLAAQYAQDVIDNGRVEGTKLTLLDDDVAAAYSGNITTENIFTFLGTPIDRANTRLFEIFSLQSSAVELSLSDPFWELISSEPNDARLKVLHEDFVVAHACYKYEDRDMNIPYVRLPEMYLILAESRVNLGQMDEGLQLLNRLRQRAGLDPTTFTDKEDLLHQIFLDRSLELSMEGDYFHNLKRLEMPIGGYSWEEAQYKLVFFIPENEIMLNSNMVQNDTW